MNDVLSVLVQKIREQPEFYLARKSLTFLFSFIEGYIWRIRKETLNYSYQCDCYSWDFMEFIFAHYNAEQNVLKGWDDVILEHTPSEEEAFDKFYELLDEFVKLGTYSLTTPQHYHVEESEDLKRISLSVLLQRIRDIPAPYIGKIKLSYLYCFIAGYKSRAIETDPNYIDCLDFGEFTKFVSEHYKTENGENWHDVILENVTSEEEAFDKFYELFDEFVAQNVNKRNGNGVFGLTPKNKFDTSTIDELMQISEDEMKLILPELMFWISNMDFPVTQGLIKVLLRYPDILVPTLEKSLKHGVPFFTTEFTYNILVYLIPELSLRHKKLLIDEIERTYSIAHLFGEGGEDIYNAAKALYDELVMMW